MAKQTKKANVNKVNKAAKKSTAIKATNKPAQTTATPATLASPPNVGFVPTAKLPANIATQIGTAQKLQGVAHVVTHVGLKKVELSILFFFSKILVSGIGHKKNLQV